MRSLWTLKYSIPTLGDAIELHNSPLSWEIYARAPSSSLINFSAAKQSAMLFGLCLDSIRRSLCSLRLKMDRKHHNALHERG